MSVLQLLFLLAYLELVSLSRNMQHIYELIHCGKRYRESWIIFGGKTQRSWVEIIDEDKSPAFMVPDVIHPDTLLEKHDDPKLNGEVSNGKCLFHGDEMSDVQCNEICLQIEHPTKIVRGECINNACFCLWLLPGQTPFQLYLSLRVSSFIGVATVQNFIKKSKKYCDTETSPFVDIDQPLAITIAPEEDVSQVQKSPDSPGSDYFYEDDPDNEFPPSPKRACRFPSQNPEPSCNTAECPSEPPKATCHHDNKLMTDDDCLGECREVARKIGAKVKGAFCREDKCYCEHTLHGHCQLSKLSALEKHRPKLRQAMTLPSSSSMFPMDNYRFLPDFGYWGCP